MKQCITVIIVLMGLPLGCGGGVIQRMDYATPTQEYGILVLTATPPDASIFIDGQFAGIVSRHAHGRVPIRAGMRRIRIEHLKYYSWYRTMKIGLQEHTIKVRLVPLITENPVLDAGNGMKTGLE